MHPSNRPISVGSQNPFYEDERISWGENSLSCLFYFSAVHSYKMFNKKRNHNLDYNWSHETCRLQHNVHCCLSTLVCLLGFMWLELALERFLTGPGELCIWNMKFAVIRVWLDRASFVSVVSAFVSLMWASLVMLLQKNHSSISKLNCDVFFSFSAVHFCYCRFCTHCVWELIAKIQKILQWMIGLFCYKPIISNKNWAKSCRLKPRLMMPTLNTMAANLIGTLTNLKKANTYFLCSSKEVYQSVNKCKCCHEVDMLWVRS